MKKMIKIGTILECIPYSRSRIYGMIAEGTFPKPVHMGGYAAFWLEEEVDAWQAKHFGATQTAAASRSESVGTSDGMYAKAA